MENLTWRKASRSSANGGDCVEVARTRDTIVTRDSKNPEGPTLQFTPTEWRTFLTALKEH